MKITVYRDFLCNYERIKSILPNKYADLVRPSYYGKKMTLVCFPNTNGPIMSGEVRKALKRMNGSFENALVFGQNFTVEALESIKEAGGTPMYVADFEWTDESYQRIRESL